MMLLLWLLVWTAFVFIVLIFHYISKEMVVESCQSRCATVANK